MTYCFPWLITLCHAVKKYRVFIEFYLFQRKGKILIKPLKDGRRNQERIRESIMQGECISIHHIRCTQ